MGLRACNQAVQFHSSFFYVVRIDHERNVSVQQTISYDLAQALSVVEQQNTTIEKKREDRTVLKVIAETLFMHIHRKLSALYAIACTKCVGVCDI